MDSRGISNRTDKMHDNMTDLSTKQSLTEIVKVPNSIQITSGLQKTKVKDNLANIIEKAVSMRSFKIFYDVDMRYILEGNIKLVFDIPDSSSALIKLRIFETAEQQSTRVAKNFFSDFGISESNN